MKGLTIMSGIAISLSIAACSSPKTNSSDEKKTGIDTTAMKSGDVFYQCPMHPAVLSDKAGDCPDCGMPLEKMTKN